MVKMYRKVIHSPYLNLLVALFLFITSGYEIWQSYEEPGLGAHHGIALFSVVQIFRILPELIWGLKELEQVSSTLEPRKPV